MFAELSHLGQSGRLGCCGGQVCEEELWTANTPAHMLDELARARAGMRAHVQAQLAAARVGGVAGTWGGIVDEEPPTPRCVDLHKVANTFQREQLQRPARMHLTQSCRFATAQRHACSRKANMNGSKARQCILLAGGQGGSCYSVALLLPGGSWWYT